MSSYINRSVTVAQIPKETNPVFMFWKRHRLVHLHLRHNVKCDLQLTESELLKRNRECGICKAQEHAGYISFASYVVT